jgi:hypothetical protein
MNQFDTLAERYRRYRAVHKYDRWLRFWLLDSALFLIKLSIVVAAFIVLLHVTPQVPGYLGNLIAQWQGKPVAQTAVAVATPATPKPVLDGVTTHSAALENKTVIPASMEPETASPSLPAWQLVTIAVNRANLREQASTSSDVLGVIRKGSTLTLFDISGRWAQVETNDERGIAGYVHVSLLEESEEQLKRKIVSP